MKNYSLCRCVNNLQVILEKRNTGLEREIVKHLNIQRDDKVIEVGFGPGAGLNAALKNLEHCSGKVYGIDISELIVSITVRLLELNSLHHRQYLTRV